MDDRMQKALAQAMKETKNKEFANKLQQDMKDMKEETERRQQREAEQRAREKQERIERETREAQRQRQERLDREKSFEAYLLRHNGPNQNGNFINPYTFFPLEDAEPERKKPKRFYGDGGLTGKLTCELTIVDGSPLFIPNTTKAFTSGDAGIATEEDHRWFDFFSYDDLKGTKWREEWPSEREPVIPGSSLRGMARSVYEQLTNSCYSQIDEKNYPNKRTNYPKKPYLMKWDAASGEWYLYEVKIYHVGDGCDKCGFDRLRAYEYYRVTSSSTDNNGRRYAKSVEPDKHGKGVLCLYHPTGFMEGKTDTLFAMAGGKFKKTIKGDSEVLVRFKRVVNDYCKVSTETNHNDARAGYEAYKERYGAHKPILVYADDSFEYLSPACMTREHFKKTIADLLRESGKHDSCDGEGDKLCPACRLFGTVNKKASLGSRVRFSDGAPSAYEFDGWATLPALSSPKISATEFYLKRPANNGDLYWNYDYYTRHGEHGTRHNYEAKLNGRKVYLHHSHRPFDLGRLYGGDLLNKKKTNVTVHPLKEGSFTFDVYFEDVSEEELANLVFALGGIEGRLQKLGHGKPLGMGSVNVKVTEITTRSYALNTFKAIDTPVDAADVEGWLPVDAGAVARRHLIKHLARNLSGIPQTAGGNAARANMGKLVRYPTSRPGQLSNNNASFTWFVNNRGTVRDPAIKQTLHVPSLEDMGDAHE